MNFITMPNFKNYSLEKKLSVMEFLASTLGTLRTAHTARWP